ncbi:MAG: aldehyde dehydrogenase family protein [Betaproteobacteria bacterium]|nr:MAG: aldehyde dehydrogenase family protein [Betaproteobacteria bacterium]
MTHDEILDRVGLTSAERAGGSLAIKSPIDGTSIARVGALTPGDVATRVHLANEAFGQWRCVPAPRRGELVRLFAEELRAAKSGLGALVTLESGKILQEGLGEVQEMIDICDFAVGLSRQLYGLTIASERPGHAMRETWHPLGVCGVISAFNFPVAVWSWNVALALVCGDPVLWKPSEKTPLCALATQTILARALARFGDAPPGLAQVLIGDATVGEALVDSHGVALVSATGSTRMGRVVGPKLAARFGRAILELGGNNAMIVAPSADLELALRAIVFSAVGTAGQRCTSLRRLIVHETAYDRLLVRLKAVYANLRIGNPLHPETLVGPLIDASAYHAMMRALDAARGQGGAITGGTRVDLGWEDAYYVRPAIAEMPAQCAIVREETFAPILYVMRYRAFDEAIAMNNDVPQGLSSCIFSTDVRETEAFLAATGSDCGIANVNIGPSGAEIGGAFGGEKATGGGREAGSDAWKAYMRRQTSAVNYSRALPLAQGIQFEL